MPDSADLRQPSAGRAQRRTLVVLVGTQAAAGVGVLAGPNLAEPAQRWAGSLGLVPATGPYLLSAAAFGLAGAGTVIGLRPDPLVLARELREMDAPHGLAGPARSPWGALQSAPTAQLEVLAAYSHSAQAADLRLCHTVALTSRCVPETEREASMKPAQPPR